MNTDKLKKFLIELGAKETEATIVVVTIPTMAKFGNTLHGRVTKETTMLVRLNEDYEIAVNDMRLEEGMRPTFKAKERAWGTHVPDTPLIEHKDQFYLSARVLSSNDPIYFVDGVEANPRQVKVIKFFSPHKPEDTGRQKTEEEVVVRTFKLESIKSITVTTAWTEFPE